MHSRNAAAVILACATAQLAFGQTEPPATERSEQGLLGLPAGPIDEPLVTDRPDFTESALAVPIGRLQVEAGVTFTDTGGSDVWTLPETLLRLGVAQDLELRLELPDYAIVRNGRDDEGLTDSSVGFKWRFVEGDASTPDLAVIGSLSVPTGEDGFGQDGVHPGAILAAGWDLSDAIAEGWSLGANLGFFEFEGSDWDTTWSVALGIPIDDRWGAFVEYYAISPELSLSRTEHVVDTGVTYLIHNNLQLDFRVGFGISDDADDFFTGAGVSYRF